MTDQDPKDPVETEDEAALAAETAAAPPSEPEVDATADSDVVVEVEAEEAVAEDEAEAPVAATPSKPAKKPAKADKSAAAQGTPKRAAGGKVLRDKHGRPVVDGPVVQAHAKYVRTSARKARLVCDHIRGKSVDEAVAILAHTPRAVAEDWEKLLKSAVANAEHNHELLGEDLKIHAVFADEGPTLKRFRPRAMGRATKIRKRTSHLTIQLTPKEQ
jgi:ribosomal protein L22